MNSRLRLTEKILQSKILTRNTSYYDERKGQGAFEYIMTYGWAIIIILIIGASMWYLGVFNIEQTSATFSGFSVIKPLMTTVILTTGGNFSGMFINGASYDITVSSIGIVNEDGAICGITKGLLVPVQSTKEFIVMGENCTVAGLHKDGDVFVLHVNITYSGMIGTAPISRTETGKLRGLYGAGAYISSSKTCQAPPPEGYGGTCCNPANETCSGTPKDASDCSPCCVGSCVTTTTTTTITTTTTTSTTTTTTTSTTTSTTIIATSVCVCSTCYNCGANDAVCPADFGVSCTDPNC